MELISKLGIDWKLLIAQIINFFILLAILYYYVYKPVLAALEKRSKCIEESLKHAEQTEKKMKEMEQLREEKIRAAEKEVGRLIEDARSDAERIKKEITDSAHVQSEGLMRQARAQIAEEKEKLVADLKQEITEIIVQATGKILQREFSKDDQKRLLEALSKEMKTAS